MVTMTVCCCCFGLFIIDAFLFNKYIEAPKLKDLHDIDLKNMTFLDQNPDDGTIISTLKGILVIFASMQS